MYFVQTNKEIHLSFKNSEKQQTQALRANICKNQAEIKKL